MLKLRVSFLVWLLPFLPFTVLADALLLKHSTRPLQAEATMEALEPWETPISGFFVRSHHGVPQVDLDRWELRIDGLVDKPVTLRLADLKKLRQHTLHAVLECSGNGRGLQTPAVPGVPWKKGAVGNAEWTGVRLADVLKKAGVQASAKFLRIEGADKPALPATPGFIRSIPLAKALDPNTLLAFFMNRQPMPALHGGPLRLVLPNWYGQNWIKWVTHLTLMEGEDPGFYMAKGYRMPKTPVKPGEKWDSTTGTPVETILVQSVIVSPVVGQRIGLGELVIKGKAFSGHGAITQVELSHDGGSRWTKTALEAPRATGGWQTFEFTLPVQKTGTLTLMSRATDAAGNVQPLEHTWNPPGYLRNNVDRVEVEVAEKTFAHEENILRARCLTCHTRELVSSQRLSAEAWGKTVTKMEGFGVKFEDDEKVRLVAYLAASFPVDLAPQSPTPISFWAEDAQLISHQYPAGASKRGGSLFKRNCAACHGPKGEGITAPRLSGREISRPYFFATVAGGKADMPAFNETLKRQDVADIAKFLGI